MSEEEPFTNRTRQGPIGEAQPPPSFDNRGRLRASIYIARSAPPIAGMMNATVAAVGGFPVGFGNWPCLRCAG